MRKIIIGTLMAAVVAAGSIGPVRPAEAANKGLYGTWSVAPLSRDDAGWTIEGFKLDRDIVAWTEVNASSSERRLYMNDGLGTTLLAQMPSAHWTGDDFTDAVKGNYDVADGIVVWMQFDGGDRDVFRRKDGVTVNVSNNTYDDARPLTSEGRIAWTSYPGSGSYNLMVNDSNGTYRLDGWHVKNYAFSGKNLYWLNRIPGEEWFRVFVNDGKTSRSVGKGDDRPIAAYFLSDDDGSVAWEYSTKQWSYDKRETFVSVDGAQAVRVIQRDVPPTVTRLEDVRGGEVLINEHNLLTYKLDATHQLLHVSPSWQAGVTAESVFTKARFFGSYGHVRHLVPENASPLVVRHDDGTEGWMSLERVAFDRFEADGDIIAAARLEGDALIYKDKVTTRIPTGGVVRDIDVRNGTIAWISGSAGSATLETATEGVLVKAGATTLRVSGRLVKIDGSPAVYLATENGPRYVFPSEGPFYSWYDGFDSLATVSPGKLAAMPLAGTVLYRPGARLVKAQNSPRVYAVTADGSLHWVTDAQVLVDRYGEDWERMVDQVPESLLAVYSFGAPINDIISYHIALASE